MNDISVKKVKEWALHYDSKPDDITNPIELVEFCVDGEPLDEKLHRKLVIEPTS